MNDAQPAEKAIETTAAEVSAADPRALELFTPTEEQIRQAPDVYRRMELEDERAVMDEIRGRALDVMLYSFQQEGRQQVGFSVVGAFEAANTLNRRGMTRIRIAPEPEPRFEECEVAGKPAIRCTVYADDPMHGSGAFGTAEQPVKQQTRNGEKHDPFVYRKALSKAQRNAFERLIPVELVEYLKAQFMGQGRVKVIPGADQADYDRPPALTDDRAKQQIATLEGLYDEIKEIDRMVMPPGQFNSMVMQTQHDHDALDRSIEHLTAFRDSEREIADLRDRLHALVPRDAFEREIGKLAGLSQQRRKAGLLTLIEAAEKAAGS